METGKHDWGMVAMGALLVLCSIFFVAYPGLTMITIAQIAGVLFALAGIVDIVSFVRLRQVMELSSWALAYAALDILLGILFLIHPLVFAGALAIVAGIGFIIFGVYEIIGAFKIRNLGGPFWGLMLLSGIVGALCGVAFFVSPATLAIFLAVFVLMRGFSLLMYGWNAGRAMM